MIDVNTGKFLFPEGQEAFWKTISPDVRAFLDDFESREEWTYQPGELPKLYEAFEDLLPRLANHEVDGNNHDISVQLIPVLVSLPLRQCIAALAWIDRNYPAEGQAGWAAVTFLQAKKIARTNGSHPMYAEARALIERIEILLSTTLATRLFTQLIRVGVK